MTDGPDMEDYGFSIGFVSSAMVSEEPENYLIEIEGEILASGDDVENILAGKLRLFYADLDEAARAGYDLSTILDMRAETCPFISLFDSKTHEFKESVRRIADDPMSPNLLILDRVEILPAFRGKGLGLASLYRCIQQYGHGCGLIALKCFPLQFEAAKRSGPDEWDRKMETAQMGRNQRACQMKLEGYYSRLGFERVGRTELMVMNPDFVHPGLEELGFS